MYEIPPRRFEELLLSAEPVDRFVAVLVASGAKANHEHFVFCDALPVQVNNVVKLLARRSADAQGKFLRGP